MNLLNKTKTGIYQHYKGNLYKVIGLAYHSETLEKFVVYRALYESEQFDPNALWVRPTEMFLEKIEFEGKKVPRFKFVKESE
ncbi:MAG TPA: DUF1653 domain-containing protein [Patescibacteria group bacterium]|nr:DUF1653 domain-containing protein [Patescibacteria group bacterium]